MLEVTGKVTRRKDAIISVCQDNGSKSLIIRDANEYAQQMLGIDNTELLSKDLREILPEKIKEAINDHIEFEEGTTDLGDILAKIRKFAVNCKGGEELLVSLKILLGEPYGKMQRFDLVMRDMSIQMEMQEQRKTVSDSLKGYEVVDETIGLPNRTSFLKELEMVNFLVNHKGVEACFAVVEIDEFDSMEASYGKVGSTAIFKSIGHNLRSNLREDDSIGILGNKNLGIILMDSNTSNISPVLNRLRYNVSIHPVIVMDFQFPAPKISMGYCQIPKNKSLEELLKITEQALSVAVKRGGNFCEAA